MAPIYIDLNHFDPSYLPINEKHIDLHIISESFTPAFGNHLDYYRRHLQIILDEVQSKNPGVFINLFAHTTMELSFLSEFIMYFEEEETKPQVVLDPILLEIFDELGVDKDAVNVMEGLLFPLTSQTSGNQSDPLTDSSREFDGSSENEALRASQKRKKSIKNKKTPCAHTPALLEEFKKIQILKEQVKLTMNVHTINLEKYYFSHIANGFSPDDFMTERRKISNAAAAKRLSAKKQEEYQVAQEKIKKLEERVKQLEGEAKQKEQSQSINYSVNPSFFTSSSNKESRTKSVSLHRQLGAH